MARSTGADDEWMVNQIAHALRNPVFAAMVQTDAVAASTDGRPEVARTCDGLRRQLERIDEIIEEMLLLGRPYRLVPEELDLASFLEGVTAPYREGRHGAPAEIVVDLDQDLEGVVWDRRATLLLLHRLLDNAVQHTAAPHRVELSARRAEGAVEITVRDRGEGVPPDILERAFLPFFPQHEGRPGLGLAVAAKLARVQGGEVTLESESGRGTTARVRLPRHVGA